jgi:3-deoxy-7-phosphoheptulonate synthase
MKGDDWTVDSWEKYHISQQPKYLNKEKVDEVISILKKEKFDKLITTFEQVDALTKELSQIENKFIVIAGDCAEPIDDNEEKVVKKKLAILNLIGEIIKLKYNKKAVLLGRIAGQYAKPRSADTEIINESKFLSIIFLLIYKITFNQLSILLTEETT